MANSEKCKICGEAAASYDDEDVKRAFGRWVTSKIIDNNKKNIK